MREREREREWELPSPAQVSTLQVELKQISSHKLVVGVQDSPAIGSEKWTTLYKKNWALPLREYRDGALIYSLVYFFYGRELNYTYCDKTPYKKFAISFCVF